jgi:hypothetical protein
MQSRRMGALVAVIAVIAAVLLFVVLRDDEGGGESTVAETTTADTTTAESEVATIVVEDGQPVGGVAELEFTKGEAIRFVVESDVDEEVHLHGYDIGKDVSAGGTVQFDVPATIEGVFEVELEQSVVPLAEITVNPA